MAKKQKSPPKDHVKAIGEGWHLLVRHPLFGRLCGLVTLSWIAPDPPFSKDGLARIVVRGPPRWQRSHTATVGFEYHYTLFANAWQRATPAEWSNVLGQALLHVVMTHADPRRTDLAWRMACEMLATDLLHHLNVGPRPDLLVYPDAALPGRTPETIADAILNAGKDGLVTYGGRGIAGLGQPSWIYGETVPNYDEKTRKQLTNLLANAIRANIIDAVAAAGATARGPGSTRHRPNSPAERARAWFIASYPLLGALAAAFEIVEDAEICALHDIKIAAVDAELRQIYINPKFPWTYESLQFVMAHELLHVGLSHMARRQGRDPYLWNVACDFVINGWLVEMGVGHLPTDSLLLDLDLGFERESAEAIYDRIVKDLRIMRRIGKCLTLRGIGKPDMLGERPPAWWSGPGCDLDTFYRRALAEGLDLHLRDGGRGLLPGDLIEEVRALQHPPIPWDVTLGQWLDNFFPPLERKRTYARASRRQSSTPDIPRPSYMRPLELMASRTFGVVVDTSGSMSPNIIARAFGAIASYAMSREVPFVRVVQCDARVHDMGYVEPEQLLQRIEVRGRGGTVLRPAIEALERADNFPKDAPTLVITDGKCDAFQVPREHAFLMPSGSRLPFRSQAPIFHFERPDD